MIVFLDFRDIPGPHWRALAEQFERRAKLPPEQQMHPRIYETRPGWKTFRIELDDSNPPHVTAEQCTALLRCLALYNLKLIQDARAAGQPLPSIYDGGVVYNAERWPFEEFACAERVHLRGWGDCDDLTAARVAELWDQGEAADLRAYWRPGSGVLHGQVRRESGLIEDPSRLLGM